jgi:N4-gp56 family major capsid protein
MALNDTTQARYNDPAGGTPSDVGPQFRTDFYHKKALIEAAKETYFGQLADTTAMPKHFGKTIKTYHYMPLLDDRNANDQGLDATGAVVVDGNLYGSSKDIGKINGKLPLVGETGGRVNRVGHTRLTIEADITKLGFFTEYSQDALDFDTDAELYEHISREMIMGANEITEDVLQMDLLNGAGVNRFAGIATSDIEIIGEGADISSVDYEDLQKMSIDLDNNRTPKKTKVITGSRMVDTRVVASGRYLYTGSEMVPTLSKMKDYHDNAAFVGVEHYAYSSVMGVNSINGEIGKVGDFRIVQVPEMAFWEGAGAVETGANAGYRATGGNYDVFPMLCVGDGSFTTIGFQTDGKSTKFKIKHSAPGDNISYSKDDPFGEIGFTSIKWWYGTLVMRPERLAVLRTVAEQ